MSSRFRVNMQSFEVKFLQLFTSLALIWVTWGSGWTVRDSFLKGRVWMDLVKGQEANVNILPKLSRPQLHYADFSL